MANTIEQLNAMRRLPEGWDGYGAASPESDAVALATEFVGLIDTLLKKRGLPATTVHVSPTRVGGVLIEWADATFEHEVEINPDRSFSFLHLNKTTGTIETRKLLPVECAVVHPDFLQELTQLVAA